MANPATEMPVWAGPKQEQSVADNNVFAVPHMSATAHTFQPSFYNGAGAHDQNYIVSSPEVDAHNHGVAPDFVFQQQAAQRPLIVHSTPPSTRSGNDKQPAIFSTDQGFPMRRFVKIDNVSEGDYERIKLNDKVSSLSTSFRCRTVQITDTSATDYLVQGSAVRDL